MPVALYTFCLVGPSGEARRALVAAQAAHLRASPEVLLRWLGTTGLVGTGDQVRQRLAAYAAAGLTDVILALPERVPHEGYAALAEALVPPAAAQPVARPHAFGVRPEANLAHTLVGRHVAAGAGQTAAVIDGGGSWSYAQLLAATRAAAGALARAGVRRGDRVAIALRDGRPWFAAFLGCAWLGAVAIPVDPLGPVDRFAMILEDCEPRLVVCDGRGPAGGWSVLHPDELGGVGGPGCASVHPEDLAYMVYSSGSTGRPKGVMHAHRDMVTGIETYARHVLELAPGEPCHSAAKLFTSLGFGNGFFRVLGAGATAVLNAARPNPRTTIELAARHGVRVLTGVPTFWAQLVEYLARHPQPDALTGVRLCVSSGDSLPAGVALAFAERVGVPLIEGLGCSECSNVVISARPGRAEPGWLGRVVPGVEVRLRDPEGRDVPDGTPGTPVDPQPVEYLRLLAPGRGDARARLRRMDQDGRHAGRRRGPLSARRPRRRPVQGRRTLGQPARGRVVPARSPGRARGRSGRCGRRTGLVRVVAWVVPNGPVPDDLATELRRHVAHRLAPYMAPREVIVCEHLPRLPSGKLDRKALRDAA